MPDGSARELPASLIFIGPGRFVAELYADDPNVPDRPSNLVSRRLEVALQLVADLDDTQLLGSRLEIVNPLLWQIGHVAWFQEKWILRRGGARRIRADADNLYESGAVAHDRRWDLDLPDRDETLRYMADVLEKVIERCRRPHSEPDDTYFALLAPSRWRLRARRLAERAVRLRPGPSETW